MEQNNAETKTLYNTSQCISTNLTKLKKIDKLKHFLKETFLYFISRKIYVLRKNT